jgi:hypothetical protein
MNVFPDWQKYAVVQKRESGAIPAGYQMLLQAGNAQGIDFDTFQDDFDLDKGKGPWDLQGNSFVSVAREVRKRYPAVEFGYQEFPVGSGAEKLAFIERHIATLKPLLLSLPDMRSYSCIVVPIIETEPTAFRCLKLNRADGSIKTLLVPKDRLVWAHDKSETAKDVAWLVKC